MGDKGPIGKTPKMVTVYAWHDAYNKARDPRPVKATRDKIRGIDGAVIVENSGEVIDAALLDSDGFYKT